MRQKITAVTCIQTRKELPVYGDTVAEVFKRCQNMGSRFEWHQPIHKVKHKGYIRYMAVMRLRT